MTDNSFNYVTAVFFGIFLCLFFASIIGLTRAATNKEIMESCKLTGTFVVQQEVYECKKKVNP